MKLIWCLAVMSPLFVWGQTTYAPSTATPTLSHYIADFSNIGEETTSAFDISDFVEKLTARELPGNSIKFCRTIFNRTRQQFLRRYTPYASFGETVRNGKYNCLTGTALYALLLDHFGIQYNIIETNYHIFLLAYPQEGTVLFEATDPTDGFITDSKQIEQRVKLYRQNTMSDSPANGKKYYSFAAELYQPVQLSELRGLLHYNISTHAYNNHDFASAIRHLDEALELYNSPRIAEFSNVLLRAILQSKLEESIKELYVSQVKTILKKTPVMASRNNPD